MDYFDYQPDARDAGLTPEQMVRLQAVMDREYPGDPMLAELHTLRACRAIGRGDLTYDEAVASPAIGDRAA